MEDTHETRVHKRQQTKKKNRMANKADTVKPIVQLEPQQVQQMIHVIRGERVILDRDLAMLYGVEVAQLNRIRYLH